ncbi:hypothetical protein V7112_16315 [Bacillus sp. JJ1566]|uniref:hypothetical protein n=1 Tax=Bacillus sp. JJ1566 TaxID=3122961 RepID=UPI002FFD7267
MKNKKLRIAWIIPNVFCYLMLIGFSTYIYINSEVLDRGNLLGLWVFIMLVLFLVSLIGSYRIWTWMKEGKL